jgi:hypothetical protein
LVINALYDPVVNVQAAAAEVVARIGADEPAAVQALGALVQSDETVVALAAASGLAQFGPAAVSEFTATCHAYKAAVTKCHDDEMHAYAAALLSMTPSAVERVEEYFQKYDEELYDVALRNFKEVQTGQAATT